jgi:hypothetical protein
MMLLLPTYSAIFMTGLSCLDTRRGQPLELTASRSAVLPEKARTKQSSIFEGLFRSRGER